MTDMQKFRVVATGALALLALPSCSLVVSPNQYVGSGTGDNDPPNLFAVSLSAYTLEPGDAVHAIPGYALDPEGDPFTVHYRWSYGVGAVGTDSPILDTSDLGEVTVETPISVEAWVSDGEMRESPHVLATAMIVPSAIRWFPRAPQSGGPMLLTMTTRGTLLRVADGELFEYVADGITGELVETPLDRRMGADAMPPASDGAGLVPGSLGNAFLYSPADPGAVYEIEAREAGPGWMARCPATGTAPVSIAQAAMLVDRLANRTLVIGGFEPETRTGSSAIFALGEDGAGCTNPGWERLDVMGDGLPPLFGSAVAMDPGNNARAFLFGGLRVMGPGVFAPVGTVYQLDLGSGSVVVTNLGVTLPSDFIGAAAVEDFTGGIVLVGGHDADGAASSAHRFDPDTHAFDALAGDAGVPELAFAQPFGNGGRDFAVGGVVSPAGEITTGVLRIGEDDVVVPLSRGTISHPSSLEGAVGGLNGIWLRIIGPEVWEMAVEPIAEDAADTFWFERLVPDLDATTGGAPGTRTGIGAATPVAPAWLVGGEEGGSLASMTPWELGLDNRWVEHTITSGAPLGRVGNVVMASPCDGVVSVGGGDGASAVYGEVLYADCSAGAHDCTWNIHADADAARVGGAGASTWTGLVVFGGSDGTALRNDVVVVPLCDNPEPATPHTTVGAAPTPRTRAAAAYDDSRMAMWVYGGTDDSGATLGDVALLEVPDTTDWSWAGITVEGRTPPPRAGAMAFVRSAGGTTGLVIVGGDGRNDVWELRSP